MQSPSFLIESPWCPTCCHVIYWYDARAACEQMDLSVPVVGVALIHWNVELTKSSPSGPGCHRGWSRHQWRHPRSWASAICMKESYFSTENLHFCLLKNCSFIHSKTDLFLNTSATTVPTSSDVIGWSGTVPAWLAAPCQRDWSGPQRCCSKRGSPAAPCPARWGPSDLHTFSS